MPYSAAGSRYDSMQYRRCGRSGLKLPAISLGLWHNFGGDRPLEETLGALDSAVRIGKALYAGISSYSPEKTREAYEILETLGTPLLIHQPSYSLLNRWIEPELLETLGALGVGCIGFSPLAQGMLTSKYLDGIPGGSRAAENSSLSPDLLTEEALAKIRALNGIAERRGQSLAQPDFSADELAEIDRYATDSGINLWARSSAD
ncbi:MAG: aldo/keto reductase [Gaiellaceae bacterium]